jgi:hypothetical protein
MIAEFGYQTRYSCGIFRLVRSPLLHNCDEGVFHAGLPPVFGTSVRADFRRRALRQDPAGV